jgi:hypothetical protein
MTQEKFLEGMNTFNNVWLYSMPFYYRHRLPISVLGNFSKLFRG